MITLRTFKHLLPRARAWSLTSSNNLRSFFVGLVGHYDAIRAFIDLVWLDGRPQSTRELLEHEEDYALMDTGLTEQQRRDRLAARIRALGGQSPRYLQDSLRDAGFDVYIHEWWWPDVSMSPDGMTLARNPLVYLRRSQNESTLTNECGEAIAECGEATAECGETSNPAGYPLVNRYTSTKTDSRALCGETLMECGDTSAECGYYLELKTQEKEYVVPIDPDTFPFYVYIGGETFPEFATIDSKRKEEFETLCLELFPLQLWGGMLINYS